MSVVGDSWTHIVVVVVAVGVEQQCEGEVREQTPGEVFRSAEGSLLRSPLRGEEARESPLPARGSCSRGRETRLALRRAHVYPDSSPSSGWETCATPPSCRP